MDYVYQKLSEKNRKKVLLIVEALIFLFAAIVMLGGGINLVYITLHLDQLSGTLQVPLGYVYAVLPFSGFLIMCFSVYHMSKIYTNQLID